MEMIESFPCAVFVQKILSANILKACEILLSFRFKKKNFDFFTTKRIVSDLKFDLYKLDSFNS